VLFKKKFTIQFYIIDQKTIIKIKWSSLISNVNLFFFLWKSKTNHLLLYLFLSLEHSNHSLREDYSHFSHLWFPYKFAKLLGRLFCRIHQQGWLKHQAIKLQFKKEEAIYSATALRHQKHTLPEATKHNKKLASFLIQLSI
jgi:hypothetical protein